MGSKITDAVPNWPRHSSQVITGDSEQLGWDNVRALSCEFSVSGSPFLVPDAPDFFTVELNTDLSTSVSYQFGDEKSDVVLWGPGDIWIYPNTQPSKWEWERPHNTVIFFLPVSRLRQLILDGLQIDVRSPALVPGISKSDFRLKCLLQLLAADMLGESHGEKMYIDSLVDATLIHLTRNYVIESEGAGHGETQLNAIQLEKVRQHVFDYVDTPLSVADLAKVVDLEPHEFPRAFRSATGITPYQYVLKERIEWAQHLLRTTDLSLAEVSLAVGFSSQSHFTRTFGKQKLMTPQNYRQAFK